MRVNAESNTINVENYLNILNYGFNHFLLLCGTHHSLHLWHLTRLFVSLSILSTLQKL